MTNEQLAHEVILDPTFRLPAGHDVGREAGGRSGHSSASQRVREALKSGFWAGLEDDLRLEPPCYGRVLRVLFHVRNSMMAVAGAEDAASWWTRTCFGSAPMLACMDGKKALRCLGL
jgi:hypothetical protein